MRSEDLVVLFFRTRTFATPGWNVHSMIEVGTMKLKVKEIKRQKTILELSLYYISTNYIISYAVLETRGRLDYLHPRTERRRIGKDTDFLECEATPGKLSRDLNFAGTLHG